MVRSDNTVRSLNDNLAATIEASTQNCMAGYIASNFQGEIIKASLERVPKYEVLLGR